MTLMNDLNDTDKQCNVKQSFEIPMISKMVSLGLVSNSNQPLISDSNQSLISNKPAELNPLDDNSRSEIIPMDTLATADVKESTQSKSSHETFIDNISKMDTFDSSKNHDLFGEFVSAQLSL